MTNTEAITEALDLLAEHPDGGKMLKEAGWYRYDGRWQHTTYAPNKKLTSWREIEHASPNDIRAITDMLAELLEDRGLSVHRCEGCDDFVWVMYETENGWLGQDDTTDNLDCDDDRLAAHYAACVEVSK